MKLEMQLFKNLNNFCFFQRKVRDKVRAETNVIVFIEDFWFRFRRYFLQLVFRKQIAYIYNN